MDVYQRRRLVALSALAVLFVIIVLLIRSCGGDDDETPVTPVSGATGTAGATALTATQFAEQGDGVCLEANTALAEIDDADPDASSSRSSILGGQLQQLQTLTLAEGEDSDQLDRFFNALQDQVAALSERATAAERGDEAQLAELDAAIDAAASQAQRSARRFGFEVCGDTSEVSSGAAEDGSAESDTSGTEVAPAPVEPAPVEPVEPAPVEPAPVEPPTDSGVAPTEPPADEGGVDSGSGGVSP